MYKYKNLCETDDPYVFKEKIDPKYLNLDEIEKRIQKGLDIIGRNENYLPIELNEQFQIIFYKKKGN